MRSVSERDQQQDGQRIILSLNRAADAKPERLFPGTWAKRAFQMLRNDLDAAGIAYVTDDGVADFHSLRHTFISNLVAGGVHPKLAQQLARHSTITLTMDRYSHVGLLDMNAALQSLPLTTAPESQGLRATGTTDQDAVVLSCTKSCNAPAEITPFQPFSTVPMSSVGDSRQAKENPQFPAGNEGFEAVRPEGVEPPTFGSEVRRSIQLSYGRKSLVKNALEKRRSSCGNSLQGSVRKKYLNQRGDLQGGWSRIRHLANPSTEVSCHCTRVGGLSGGQPFKFCGPGD